MVSGSEGRKSVDSLSSLSSITHKTDFPFHRQYAPGPFGKQRRESVSTVHSVGGTLDTAIGNWPEPVTELGQNAISTLLQPPIVRSGLQPHTSAPAHTTHKPPTAKDIPPVTLSNIPHVEASAFSEYLVHVGALHEQLRRAKESEDEQAAVFGGTPRRNSSKDDLGDAVNDGLLRPGRKRPSSSRKPSVSSISSIALADVPSPSKRGPGSRRGTQGPPPLSTIPNVYFDEDFHLENPRTFDVVSERSEVVPSTPAPGNEKAGTVAAAAQVPRKALATNAILQEKLSWYMDTVEMHLISSISTASTAFFTALGSLKELHTEAADSVDRIQALRTELGALDDAIAVRGLEVVQKKRRRQNVQQFQAAVLQLKDIVDEVAACEGLVDEGEVDKALDGIDGLDKLIAGEQNPQHPHPRPYPLRNLRGASALQGVNDDIATLRLRIGKAYEARFVSVLLRDLRQYTESVSRQDVLMRWNSASMRARGGHRRDPSAFPAYLAATEPLRAELLPLLTGLQRAKHLAAASQVFRETVLREIKNLVRRPLPSSNEDDNESMMSSSTISGSRHMTQSEKSSILARNLRALDPADGEELLCKIYIGVTETLRRLTTQLKVLLDVASSIGQGSGAGAALKSPPFSPSGRPMAPPVSDAGMEAQAEIHRTLDMSNLLGQAIDTAQDKVVRVLRVRAEQSTHLSFAWFLRYFTLNLHFATECEAISGRSGLSLKTEVNGHVKEYVQYHGDTQMKKLAQGMDQDQWAAKDFTDRDAQLLRQIVDASTKDVDAWTEGVMLWVPCAEAEDSKDGKDGKDETPAPAAGGGGKAKTRSAVVDEETFLLPQSAVLCLDGMSHYMHLTVAIPFMTVDVATSLVQYLQLFNSRCTQLILGAGATRSAGLKNITTRHLAVASQSLAFIAAVIPHVREFVRRRAGPGSGGSGGGNAVANVMGEFDKVRRLYQEHQNSIYDKLVEIMGGRAQAHARTMRGIDWDASGATASGPVVHAYMDTLVKETTTLHRNLAKTLPEGTVQFIMTAVFAEYKEQLGGVLRAAEVKTAAGRDSMLLDIDSLGARLSKLDSFGDCGSFLRDIVESKKIEEPKPVKDEKKEKEEKEKEEKEKEEKEKEEKEKEEKEKKAKAEKEKAEKEKEEEEKAEKEAEEKVKEVKTEPKETKETKEAEKEVEKAKNEESKEAKEAKEAKEVEEVKVKEAGDNVDKVKVEDEQAKVEAETKVAHDGHDKTENAPANGTYAISDENTSPPPREDKPATNTTVAEVDQTVQDDGAKPKTEQPPPAAGSGNKNANKSKGGKGNKNRNGKGRR